MDLSIIIPAFNEAAKIGRDVEAAAAFLTENHLAGEIIVADDGSTDGTADAAGRVELPDIVGRTVIRGKSHHGKGHAVRTGIREARGDLVLFADSGLCVPFGNALRGLQLIRGGKCDIAHGSRKLPGSVVRQPRPQVRRLVSDAFSALIPHLAGMPGDLTDTQCGFKLYRGDVARELYAGCFTDGFLFDVEIILRALKKNYVIREFPVEWTNDPDSRLNPLRHGLGMLAELITIRRADL